MERIKLVFDVFTKVVTFVLIGSATYVMLFFPQLTLTIDFIWELILCSLLTSLGTLLYTESSTKVTIMKCFIHYIWVNIVVVGCGLIFDWFNVNSLPQVVSLLVMIAVIYLIVSALTWHRALKDANQLNDKLMEYQAHGQSKEGQ